MSFQGNRQGHGVGFSGFKKNRTLDQVSKNFFQSRSSPSLMEDVFQQMERDKKVEILTKKSSEMGRISGIFGRLFIEEPIFPMLEGFENIVEKLEKSKADSDFAILAKALKLSPIGDEDDALKAEEMLEYLSRAFGEDMPEEIEHYAHLLFLLLREYEEKQGVLEELKAKPHELLRAFLEDYQLYQKDLVPDCFASPSQVSEFLNQKKGRSKLSYDQALALGKRFHVDFRCFLEE